MVSSLENLSGRVERLLAPQKRVGGRQFSLDLAVEDFQPHLKKPTSSIYGFIDFLSEVAPRGEVYIFGGVIRDLALIGRRGFSSDVDVVVEGDWSLCESYLRKSGAIRNKFGGYRLEVSGWPLDIWKAEETWAIKQGLVSYRGISSLLDTTVLNWDAALMHWRTKKIICKENYLEHLRDGILDLVLEQNPNPLGMYVRVLRHWCSKDARKVTVRTLRYLADCSRQYSYDDVAAAERKSYLSYAVDPKICHWLRLMNDEEGESFIAKCNTASEKMRKELLLI